MGKPSGRAGSVARRAGAGAVKVRVEHRCSQGTINEAWGSDVDFRYFPDPETGLPHIYGHGVTESEVEEVFRSRGDDYPASDDARMKVGQTAAGRYLQVIYVLDEDKKGAFVITAYDLTGNAKRAARRRRRRRRGR